MQNREPRIPWLVPFSVVVPDLKEKTKMKSFLLIAVCLTLASAGHADEPKTLPPGEPGSQPTGSTNSTETAVPKRYPLLRRLSAQFMEAFQRLAGQHYPWVLSNPIDVTRKR
jgi:hypothetical protein